MDAFGCSTRVQKMNASTHPSDMAGYSGLQVTVVCEHARAGACMSTRTHMLACDFIMNQTADVSDVSSIAEINLERNINHTSSINDDVCSICIQCLLKYLISTQICGN